MMKFMMNFYSSTKSLVLWQSVNFSLWIHFWSRKLWGCLLSCPGTLTRIWCCHWRVSLEEATWWEVLSFSWHVKLRSLLSMALLKITSVSCQTFHFPVKLILKIKDCVWDITKPIMVALFAPSSLHYWYFTYYFCQDLYYKTQFYSVLSQSSICHANSTEQSKITTWNLISSCDIYTHKITQKITCHHCRHFMVAGKNTPYWRSHVYIRWFNSSIHPLLEQYF